MPRLIAVAVLALLAAPATSATGPAAGPVADGCAPEALQQRWNEGYVQGVEDIKAQLAGATAAMQRQVQAQLDAQLGQLHRQNEAELRSSMRAAQDRALREAVATPMPKVLTEGATTTTMPAVPAHAASGAGREAASAPGLPDDPAQLPPGSRVVIDNAERLPPDLYAALLAYLKS